MRIRGFLSTVTLIGICAFASSAAVSVERPTRPVIGIGGGSIGGGSESAAVIVKCAPGQANQGTGGAGGSQNGNCSCTQSGEGSVTCSCSSSTQGSSPPAVNADGRGLFVDGIYASAGFSPDMLDEIANAESCADAVVALRSGECRFAAASNLWYSCEF